MTGFKECTTTIFRGNCENLSWLLFAHDFVGWTREVFFFVTIESSAVCFFHTRTRWCEVRRRDAIVADIDDMPQCVVSWWSNAILKELTNSICMRAGNCEDGKKYVQNIHGQPNICMKITGSRALEKLFEYKFRNLISFSECSLCCAGPALKTYNNRHESETKLTMKKVAWTAVELWLIRQNFFGSKLHSWNILNWLNSNYVFCAAQCKRRTESTCDAPMTHALAGNQLHTLGTKRIIQKKKRKFSARSTSSPSQTQQEVNARELIWYSVTNFYAQTNFSSLLAFFSHHNQNLLDVVSGWIYVTRLHRVCVWVFNFPVGHPHKISGPRRNWTTKS